MCACLLFTSEAVGMCVLALYQRERWYVCACPLPARALVCACLLFTSETVGMCVLAFTSENVGMCVLALCQ